MISFKTHTHLNLSAQLEGFFMYLCNQINTYLRNKKRMRIVTLIITIIIFTDMTTAQITLLSNENKTPTYSEIINYYKMLDSTCEYMHLIEMGQTDCGFPLHLLVIDADKDFNPEASRSKGKSILLINNGIHPGEPDGIDACLQLTDTFIKDVSLIQKLENLTICIIPVYNVDGALNRNSTTRVNQYGPESYGFRGNARNFDLNRDFIKSESLNAKSFIEIFRTWDPDVFVDTHVSNGADYQYVMTLIPTQHDKLAQPLGDYLKNSMLPVLYDEMNKSGFPMTPYVNEINRIPDDGIAGFLDLGRYSTGYTALYNTLGFMPETHMLKPYPQRVASTLALLNIYIKYCNAHATEIMRVRNAAKTAIRTARSFPINWTLNETQHEQFMFKGYTAKYKPSEVSGLERLYYDREAPFEKNIPFYDSYNASLVINAPKAYIIPKAWNEIVMRFKLNKIIMQQLEQDTIMEVEVYYIEDFANTPNPFEGHYLHSNIQVRSEIQKIQYYKGDYIVYMNQDCNNFIIQTLEPQGPDSFFAWGFFDAILMQKEWFSDYVFEDLAAEILNENPKLREELIAKQKADANFAADAWEQLVFVFEHSKYKEITHRRYPVARVLR